MLADVNFHINLVSTLILNTTFDARSTQDLNFPLADSSLYKVRIHFAYQH